MSHVIIDRRKNDKGKSSVNRRKFFNRVRGILKDNIKDVVNNGTLRDLVSGKGKRVKVPIRDLEEPNFHHDGTGIKDIVIPGNDKYVVGDKIKRPPEGGGRSKAGEDGDGQDSFSFELTKEEFFDLFFDKCALPDLVKETLAIMSEETIQRSGFSPDGSPSQMNIMRSMRNARSRRSGLKALKNKKLKVLEEKEQELINDISGRTTQGLDCSIEQDALDKLRIEIETLRRRLKSIPFVDPVDLRFNNFTRVDSPKLQAAMVLLMDVSGSMDEQKKMLAKTFYLLLYLFLVRHYTKISLEYIIYHTRAQVVDEENFYYGQETGGTVTSRGVDLAYEVIMKKFNPSLWNVYLAHSSDGDNFEHDNPLVIDTVVNKLLPILQYYAYVQIAPDDQVRFSFGDQPITLMDIFAPLAEKHKNMSVAEVTNEENVYPVFLKLFERKK